MGLRILQEFQQHIQREGGKSLEPWKSQSSETDKFVLQVLNEVCDLLESASQDELLTLSTFLHALISLFSKNMGLQAMMLLSFALREFVSSDETSILILGVKCFSLTYCTLFRVLLHNS